MPGIARDAGRDVAGGSLIQGSSNIFVENMPIVRIGDAVAGHGRPPHNSAIMVAGSNNVFANGISVCREGDPANCGHVASGSGTVFAN